MMKITLIALALISFVAAFNGKSLDQHFDEFKVKFNRQYTSADEEMARKMVFSANMKKMMDLNRRDINKPYGVTKFMDVSPEEFRAQYLMKVDFNASTTPKKDAAFVKVEAPAALPTNFDWNNQSPDCVTGVKNQGQCGSCWAFSGVETIESVCCLAGYALTVLSEQQIVDCDTNGGVQGCNGGFPEDVYTYAQTFGGLDTEAQYPYEAQDGTCQATTQGMFKCPIASWKWVSQSAGDEDHMAQVLYQNSPLSIACDAESWQYYNGGVISADSCGQQLDHAIQITGWKVVNGQKAWTVRNSWGADWGENGYLYLQYGQNTCGIATHVTAPCVNKQSGGGQVC